MTVQDAWVDTSDRSRRDDVAKDLTGRLSTAPGTDAGTDDLLAAELAQALVTPELAQTAQPDEGAAAVLAALADAGLVEVEGGTATPLPRGGVPRRRGRRRLRRQRRPGLRRAERGVDGAGP